MDLREAIQNATGEPAVWKPQPGEYMIGRVLSIRDVETDMGKSRLAEIEDEDTGEVKTLFLTTMLKDRFMEYGIEPGDRIAVKYHGKKQNAKGREYHHWTVFVDRESRVAQEKAAQKLQDAFGDTDEDEPEDDEEIPF